MASIQAQLSSADNMQKLTCYMSANSFVLMSLNRGKIVSQRTGKRLEKGDTNLINITRRGRLRKGTQILKPNRLVL